MCAVRCGAAVQGGGSAGELQEAAAFSGGRRRRGRPRRGCDHVRGRDRH